MRAFCCFSIFANIKNSQKQSHSAKEWRIGDALGFFIIQLGVENQNNQRRDPLATSKNFVEKFSQCRQNSKAKQKSFKNYGTQMWHLLEAPAIAF